MSKQIASMTEKQLGVENADLRARLNESEATLQVIRRGEADALIGAGASGEQIVSLQRAEKALELSEEKYRTLVNEVDDGFFMTDSSGIFTFANPALARIYGVESPQALVGRKFSDFQASKEHTILGEAFRSAMQTGRSPEVITGEILRPDGTLASIEFKPAMIVKDGRIVGSKGVVRDVTERERAEKGLRESEEKYRNIFDNVQDVYFETLLDGTILEISPSIELATKGQYHREDFLGRSIYEFYADIENRHTLAAALQNAGRVTDFEVTVKNRDNSLIACSISAKTQLNAQGNPEKIIGSMRDVTKRKQAEEELRDSEAEYRHLFENSVVGISQALSDGRLLRTNNAFAKMYGYANPEEIVAAVSDIKQLYAHPEDRNEVIRILSEKGFMEPREMSVVRRDGSPFIVLVGAREIRDSDGSLRYYQAEHVDITARKQAEEELRQSEARFRILFEQAADVILQMEITPEGIPVIREANNATLKILGYERDELIGQPVSFIEDVSDAPTVVEGRRRNILSGAGSVFETRHRCKDGTTRDFECSVTEMKVGAKTFAISVERDITERTRSVDKIRRQLEHLTAMSAIDRVIAANFDLQLSLSEILTHVTAELGMDAAEIMILNSKSQMLEFCAEHGFRTKPVKKAQIRLGEGFAGRAALEHHLVQVSDLQDPSENASSPAHWKSEEFVCYFCAPLISKGQVKGVLEVFHRAAAAPDAEWFDFLNALAGQTAIAIENSTLFVSLERSNFELAMAYDATIEGWSRALDLRDKETEGHTQRVTETTVKLARAFGVSEMDLVQVRWGALLHDIGKMGVPDEILHKPGPLTDEEWVAMRKHPAFAYEMLAPIHYLRLALDIPYCHHEKWDGSGYPRGLKGAQIPLIARIFSVVDVWDALRSNRPYRAAWPEEKVLDYLRASSGTFFDPHVVDLVLQNQGLFEVSPVPG